MQAVAPVDWALTASCMRPPVARGMTGARANSAMQIDDSICTLAKNPGNAIELELGARVGLWLWSSGRSVRI
jgi:hypothetical protein